MRLSQIFIVSIIAVSCVMMLHSDNSGSLGKSDIQGAEKVIGLTFSDPERDSLLQNLQERLEAYAKMRNVDLANSVVPALQFNPIPVGFTFSSSASSMELSEIENVEMPDNINDLAFYTIRELGELIRTRKISSTELTQFFIERLKKYDSLLHCVITLTEKRALNEAKQVDEEIAAGNYRGALHGIPYGAKDLLAVSGYKTTWGAAPYKDQIIEEDATVIKKLREAGAVLVAKLTLGALAWGDVWYGEKTRNPWDLEQGSSGSSAGSASATAAGLVPFAIGSETWGSIVSPSTRCGTTGLRPTYGRISRHGAMALSWSMDKLGPICRTVEDCALVFNALYGPDEIDQSVLNVPFTYTSDLNMNQLRIGYLKSAFEEEYDNAERDKKVLEVFRGRGVELIPVELPDFPVPSLSFILSAEAAAAFDALTRSNRDDQLVRQIRNAWPNVFRAARFIPAVEYIQANRIRYQLIQAMTNVFKKVDVYIAPSFGGDNLLRTNLTGHPCVVLPNGFNEKGSPTSISFIGNLFEEGTLMAVAKFYQDATVHHTKHPEQFMHH